jgi:hypothetical protein
MPRRIKRKSGLSWACRRFAERYTDPDRSGPTLWKAHLRPPRGRQGALQSVFEPRRGRQGALESVEATPKGSGRRSTKRFLTPIGSKWRFGKRFRDPNRVAPALWVCVLAKNSHSGVGFIGLESSVVSGDYSSIERQIHILTVTRYPCDPCFYYRTAKNETGDLGYRVSSGGPLWMPTMKNARTS